MKNSKPPVSKDSSRPENMDSPSYRLAALDEDFLLGDSMRGVRFMLEYAKAEEHLRDWGVASTVVVFGSARFKPDGPENHARWYNAARELGKIVSKRGGALKKKQDPRHNVIATGGGPGIMEAANRGAQDVGAPNIGFNITLPHEQEPNPYSTPELTFQFHYFAMRKMHLAMRANALVVFPGGFGTMDELFEILCLRQTMKITTPLPIILFDKEFWTSTFNLQHLIDVGTINADDIELFSYADTAEEAWEHMVERGLGSIPAK